MPPETSEDIRKYSRVGIKKITMIIMATLMAGILTLSATGAGKPVPSNLFNIGDSIGEGEAADGVVGGKRHGSVWSTGYDPEDIAFSLNERFERLDPAGYYENNSSRDAVFNHADSGSKMDDFAEQSEKIISAAALTPLGKAGMVTVLLGGNDVCADSIAQMTPADQFEQQYRAGLDVFSASDATKNAYIHVSSIPAIYWLWEARRSDDWCRLVAWPFVPCQNLLANPENDCRPGGSHLVPDVIYPEDGPNCRRRKLFHARIRDIYNPILKRVLAEYRSDGRLPKAYYIDIFDFSFDETHVNGGDCFHPSVKGHAALADEQWCQSPWGRFDASCGGAMALPWLPLLLLND
jgi:lysophospholipase L1-like esterase